MGSVSEAGPILSRELHRASIESLGRVLGGKPASERAAELPRDALRRLNAGEVSVVPHAGGDAG